MPNESPFPAGQPAHHATHAGPGYEVRDTNVRGVVIFLVGLTALIIVVQVVLWAVLRGLESTNPEPNLTIAPPTMVADQLHALRLREDEALAGKVAGAKMPIAAALQEIEEKGLPLSAAGLTEADINSHSGMPASKSAEPTKK